MTAKDAMEILISDPDHVAMMEKKERERERIISRNRRDAVPVLAELASVGFPMDRLGNLLVTFGKEHRAVIPVLLKWLQRLDNLDVKESIIRALGDKMARPAAARPLIEEFRRTPVIGERRMLHYKSAIANALSVVADDSVFDDIVDLTCDRRHGWSRALLCTALARMKNPRSEDVLLEVLDGERGEPAAAVTRFAIRALGNRKSLKAKPTIREFLDHPEPLVRKEAQKSLDKIERAEQKAREKAQRGPS